MASSHLSVEVRRTQVPTPPRAQHLIGLLCAIACGAIVAELRKADLKWDKTIKTGKARIQPN